MVEGEEERYSLWPMPQQFAFVSSDGGAVYWRETRYMAFESSLRLCLVARND